MVFAKKFHENSLLRKIARQVLLLSKQTNMQPPKLVEQTNM